ncbi:Similar to conserved hypothetical protein [Ajellomyces capsulatus NAm1]; acc. no. XP_001543648 [Pyronema omphalodes CBS 100304]|uniref:DUF8032 domain-containing protein n=1 Tax=Pyronema omphalodes (strain CBS 100304) TaxID=1076935 RepID=U4L626_PYROM|nr:Similar to conserved hypothetical protein [Ajellomyces capsulatus NAm1]; acc. no. XP_001543648 [Pyronema omphalodes CBS 100304]
MNRPTYPPIYHTTQSNSPASVASPPGGDHRSVYQQQPMQTPMYGYQQYQQPAAPPPPYMSQQHPQHMQNQQPMLMSHAQNQTMTPPQQHHHQQVAPSPSAAPKMPQQHQQAPVHKASPGTAPPSSGSNKTSSINPNAAPGPIPATTPLVVRQDQNGVQWIMFEYSRDRIKMEYTIRCDVASVNVDALSPEFKTENCVYPRACCSKDQYRGNRLVYETECNSVGWALAELNPPLRGKRGLIQRAVDSWRNSNQDPRLRSRRVRRMAKLNNRKATAQASQAHLGAGSPGVQALPSSSVQTGLLKGPSNLMPTAGQQLHHHHTATADNSGAATNGDDEMGAMLQGHQHSQQPAYGNVQSHLTSGDNSRSTSGHLSPAVGGDEFGNAHAHAHHHHQPGPTSGDDIRPRHVFNNGYPTSYPSQNVGGPSMAPPMHHGMDPMGPSTSATNAVATSTPPVSNTSLFGDIPEHKRRKFILVDDPHRGSRVRVRVMLDQVHMQEIPDSYRKSNSVYPRSFISSQEELDNSGTEIHTQVVVPMLDGTNMTVPTPPPSSTKRKKENDLNELGYRMSWSQSRVFAGRTMFLQRALDAYRNKMRSSMMAAGTDVMSSAPHLETRVGKRKWMDRTRRSRGAASSN